MEQMKAKIKEIELAQQKSHDELMTGQTYLDDDEIEWLIDIAKKNTLIC